MNNVGGLPFDGMDNLPRGSPVRGSLFHYQTHRIATRCGHSDGPKTKGTGQETLRAFSKP